MLDNFLDTKMLLIMISLTIFYYYITDSDNIVLQYN
jgi:hypothetical protein